MTKVLVPEELAEQLKKVLDSLLADCHIDVKAECDACGLSASQYQAMLALENGPRTMQQIAKSILASPSTATRVVDQLVQIKLVRRLPDATDRRATWIHLTPKGSRQLRQAKDMRLQNARNILAIINPADWEHLLENLAKLEAASRVCHEAALEEGGEKRNDGAAPAVRQPELAQAS